MRRLSSVALFMAACGLSQHVDAITLDTSFNGGGAAADYLDLGTSYADFFADAVVSPTTGAFYSVGRSEVVSAGGQTHAILFKRLANGTRDNSFGTGSPVKSRIVMIGEGAGRSASFDAVAVGVGAVYTAGYQEQHSGKRCGVVFKNFDNSSFKGPADAAFGVLSRFSHCAADTTAITFSDLVVLPDNRVLVTGNGVQPGGERQGFLLRLTASGQLDTTFNPSGINGSPGKIMFNIRPGKDDTALRIAVTSQGYYVAGNTTASVSWFYPMFNHNIDAWVARVTPAGALDTTFNATGTQIISFDSYPSDGADLLADMTVDASGRPLVLVNSDPAQLLYDDTANWDPSRAFMSRARVVRLATNGTRDTSYGGSGVQLTWTDSVSCVEYCDYDEPGSLLATPGGDVIVAGRRVPAAWWGEPVTTSQLTLHRINNSGVVVLAELFAGWVQSEGWKVLPQSDGRIVVGGLVRTSTLSSDADFLLARFLAP